MVWDLSIRYYQHCPTDGLCGFEVWVRQKGSIPLLSKLREADRCVIRGQPSGVGASKILRRAVHMQYMAHLHTVDSD